MHNFYNIFNKKPGLLWKTGFLTCNSYYLDGMLSIKSNNILMLS
jgi:hypothetical protein